MLDRYCQASCSVEKNDLVSKSLHWHLVAQRKIMSGNGQVGPMAGKRVWAGAAEECYW